MQFSLKHAPLVGLATLIALGLAAAHPAQAQTLDTANGHYYEYVPVSQISWSDANTNADALTYGGLTGHLATITSPDENAFVTALIGDNTSWLGGYRTGPGKTNDNFAWVTGEGFTYAKWDTVGGEPTNGGYTTTIVENDIEMYGANSGNDDGGWNDLAGNNTANIKGYVVEFETPEPSSVAAFAFTGLFAAGLMLRARKRRMA